MTAHENSGLTVEVQPLTAHDFAPFGQVTVTAGGARRNPVSDAFARTVEAVEPRLWIATVANAIELPLTLLALERHPYSAQTFLPANGRPYLVVVCHADGAGQPDLETLRAFQASPDQGVTYARNVWHHGLTALEAPAQFVVCMSFTGTGGDDVFVPLGLPVQLVSSGVKNAKNE